MNFTEMSRTTSGSGRRMSEADSLCASAALAGRGSAPNVGSFYHLRGCELTGRACHGTACFVARNSRGGAAAEGDPRVYCLGRCFEAPAEGLSNHRPRMAIHSREGVILSRMVKGGARALDAYRAAGGYRALERGLASTPSTLLEAVEKSGLRGRGGAGFPTGTKWRAAAQQAGAPKYVIANADEGDAGAYIDRFLLEDDPHALIEGMVLCARAIGASHGWIYLRHEYPAAETILRGALSEAREAGFLGRRILASDFDFDIEVVVGHGSYVCGEESALIRSIEGRRPEPVAHPPYPMECGLFGRPTVVNNVETLANIPWIVAHGPEAYRDMGFAQSHGTKVVSLNSLFAKPGLYEIEFGVTVRHIVETLGGGLRKGTLKGVMIGGPLSGIVPPQLLDTPFGFEELAAIGGSVGHGGIVAFDEHTSIAALVHHVFSFGAYESCGKCTPCRLGSRRIEEIFAEIARGRRSSTATAIEWQEIANALHWTSLCGHGTGLGAFAESVLRYYGEEVAACFT